MQDAGFCSPDRIFRSSCSFFFSREQAERVCSDRMNPNIAFITSLKENPKIASNEDSSLKAVLMQNYILLRFEDVSLNPESYVKYIYGFIGHDPTVEVIRWLRGATTSTKSFTKRPFSTMRNSKTVVEAWRSTISLEGALMVQKICAVSLETLGYRKFETKEDLLDNSLSSFNLNSNEGTK